MGKLSPIASVALSEAAQTVEASGATGSQPVILRAAANRNIPAVAAASDPVVTGGAKEEPKLAANSARALPDYISGGSTEKVAVAKDQPVAPASQAEHPAEGIKTANAATSGPVVIQARKPEAAAESAPVKPEPQLQDAGAQEPASPATTVQQPVQSAPTLQLPQQPAAVAVSQPEAKPQLDPAQLQTKVAALQTEPPVSQLSLPASQAGQAVASLEPQPELVAPIPMPREARPSASARNGAVVIEVGPDGRAIRRNVEDDSNISDFVSADDLQDWQSGPLSDFLAQHRQREASRRSSAREDRFDRDGFFLDEGPNRPSRRSREDFFFN